MSADLRNTVDNLCVLPEDMDLAYLAAKDFLMRHPGLKKGDERYEHSIHARVVIAYHERLALAVSMLRELGVRFEVE